MTIRKSAYDTAACIGYSVGIEKIKDVILTRMKSVSSNEAIIEINGEYPIDQSIQSFMHPIVLEDGEYNKIAIDVRPYTTYGQSQNTTIIRDKKGYDALRLRGAINQLWIGKNQVTLRSFSPLPIALFSNMIAEAINKRIPIDPGDQLKIAILAAVLYYSNFIDEYDKSPAAKSQMVGFISRSLSINSTQVFDTVEAAEGAYAYIDSLDTFCLACREITMSVRLDSFNTALLFAIVGGYWYGNNGRELIAVALEHPPTWLTLIYQALTERGFKNTGIANMLDRQTYKKLSGNYEIQLLNKVGNFID